MHIIPQKVEMINNRKSLIQDEYIKKYLAEKKLNLTTTLDTKVQQCGFCCHCNADKCLPYNFSTIKLLEKRPGKIICPGA